MNRAPPNNISRSHEPTESKNSCALPGLLQVGSASDALAVAQDDEMSKVSIFDTKAPASIFAWSAKVDGAHTSPEYVAVQEIVESGRIGGMFRERPKRRPLTHFNALAPALSPQSFDKYLNT